MSRGILTVVSGFSGAGKGTLMKALTEKYGQYALSVSATTRAPRPGEQDGVQYFFKTKEEFEEMIRQDAFIEYAAYVEHYYGTPRAYVEEQLEKGRDVILEIEVQGALKVKHRMPDTLLLFRDASQRGRTGEKAHEPRDGNSGGHPVADGPGGGRIRIYEGLRLYCRQRPGGCLRGTHAPADPDAA